MIYTASFSVVKEKNQVVDISLFNSVPDLSNLIFYKCYLNSTINISDGFLRFSAIRRHFVNVKRDTIFVMGNNDDIEKIENLENHCIQATSLFSKNKYRLKKGIYIAKKFEHETFWTSNWIVRWMNGFDPLKQNAS
jgi:hypothetical protein